MDVKRVEIDEERGVAVIYGEEIKLASGFKENERGSWYVWTSDLKPDKKYVVTVLNAKGEITLIWTGYYRPDMFAMRLYPLWNANNIDCGAIFISERLIKYREILQCSDAKH